MNDLIKLLTSQEIIIVYIVVGIACFLYFIIYLIDKSYYKRKQKHNTKELNRLVEDINSTLEFEKIEEETPVQTLEEKQVTYVEPVLVEKEETAPIKQVVKEEKVVEEVKTIEPIKEEVKEVKEVENSKPVIIENKEEQTSIVEEESENIESLVLDNMETEPVEEEITYTSIEPSHEEAQEELRRLTEELEKAEEETKNIDLTSYEEAQERDAIISLDELIKKSKEMYASNELTQYEDEGNEPISLADLEAKMKQVAAIEEEPVEYTEPVIEPIIEETPVVEQMVLDDFDTVKVEVEKRPVYQESFKYKPSPIISPVYGIEKKISQNDLELENTANYEKLDEEIKKTNDFIMTLKDLQKHLD